MIMSIISEGDTAALANAPLEGLDHSEGVLRLHAPVEDGHECSELRKLRERGMIQPSKEHADKDQQNPGASIASAFYGSAS